MSLLELYRSNYPRVYEHNWKDLAEGNRLDSEDLVDSICVKYGDVNLQNGKIRLISWIILVSFLFCGCTSYHTYEKGTSSELVAEINEKGESEKAKIYLSDGYNYSATKLHFQPDSTFWYAGESNMQVSHPTSDIDKIKFYDRSRGVWDGLAVGTVTGMVLGCIVGYAFSSPSSPYDDDATVGDVLLGGIAGAAIIGLICIPFGWSIAHTDVYTIEDPMVHKGE